METGRVIVVGSVNVDLAVIAPRLPRAGETVTGGDVAQHHGGKGGNQAVAAARLGASVAFVGAVGHDEFGTAAADALAAEAIDVSALERVFRPTGVALIIVDRAGENQITVAPGANEAVSADGVERALRALRPRPGDVILTCREIRGPAVRAALSVARSSGALGILNPAPADGIDGATIALADLLTPNRSELALITGEADPEAGARALLRITAADLPEPPAVGPPPTGPVAHPSRDQAEAGAGSAKPAPALHGAGPRPPTAGPSGARLRAVIVTLGADGALLVPAGGAALRLPAPAVRPTDTTGAGDTFNGALAAGLAAGMSLPAAAGRAVRAAAISTLRAGARGGMPTAAEVDGAAAPG